MPTGATHLRGSGEKIARPSCRCGTRVYACVRSQLSLSLSLFLFLSSRISRHSSRSMKGSTCYLFCRQCSCSDEDPRMKFFHHSTTTRRQRAEGKERESGRAQAPRRSAACSPNPDTSADISKQFFTIAFTIYRRFFKSQRVACDTVTTMENEERQGKCTYRGYRNYFRRE